MFATQVLSEDLSENVEKDDDNAEIVGFILVNDGRYEIKKGETKIGRDPAICSIVIENLAVSKVHAVIESDGIDDTFIYDAESTNQTKLGKKTLKPHYRYKLDNDSNVTFGNITAKFIWPLSGRENSHSKSNLEYFKQSNGPEDIFDAVTQVTAPHNSGKILHIEKEPKNLQIFQIPDLVDEEKLKESFGSSKDSGKVTQCQLDSKDFVSRAEYCNGSYDPSAIFSLSTQCQISQPCSSTKGKPEDFRDNPGNNELDSVKALLYDGQDGVLCTFMSMHSPGGQAPSELPKEIKTEVVQEDCSGVFDAQTQVQGVLIQSNNKASAEQTLQFNEDLGCQNSPEPNTGRSGFDEGTKVNPASTASEKFNIGIKDTEDFIKTPEFNRNPPLEECRNSSLSAPVGDQVSPNIPQEYDEECYFEKTVDISVAEEPPQNDDLICTQKFEVLPEGLQETEQETNNVPGNDELNESNEDFMETQLYDFKKLQNDRGPEEETAGKPTGVPFVISESPEKDTEPNAEALNHFTQRNAEEDFISTQAFGEMIQDGNASINSSRSSGRSDDDYNDDEDFIATQPVDLLPSSTAKHKCFQEPTSTRTSSRESSPDLLDSGFSVKTCTDMSKRPKASSSELLEKTDSVFLTSVKKESDEDVNIFPVKNVERVESSGEETESDLEIIFDKCDASKKITRIGEFMDKSSKTESQQPENNTTAAGSGMHENNDSNSSYVFQLEPEAIADVASSPTLSKQNIVPDQGRAAESDSDATDCEDIAAVEHKMPAEVPGVSTSDETELPTSAPPNKISSPDDGGQDDKESPSFETGNENDYWSQLSLEMPDTQDMESTISKIFHNRGDAMAQDADPKKEVDYQTPSKKLKTEVKIDTFGTGSIRGQPERQVDSPLKRLGNSNGEIEAVPPKKSKMESSDRRLRSSEKQFLRLWQAHDIEQIQPYRTRSSLKNAVPNKTDVPSNISNKFETSRRESRAKRKTTKKLSFDITPYLCKGAESKRTFFEGKKKETSPKESKSVERCQRVLRSSSRSSGNVIPPGRQALTRPRRNSRFKKEEFFGNPCVSVIFTGFDCESLEKIISDLGGKKTNDVTLGDVVVADKVRRTVKFLSAVALSLPIASPQWLLACRAEKKFLNPWDFILKDAESERKWGFELKASLERSKSAKLLQGLSVYATASAKPPVKDLTAIVKYCGGTPLLEVPDVWPKKTVIVSCPEDERWWPLAKSRNVKIVHYEFILTGILRQQLDFKTYKLSTVGTLVGSTPFSHSTMKAGLELELLKEFRATITSEATPGTDLSVWRRSRE